MTRRRWIADRTEGERAFLTGSNAEHLTRVLRARVGQEFEIATGDSVRMGRIALMNESEVIFDLGASVATTEQGSVSLLLAVFKFDRMEWAIEKATELGVTSVLPVIARRTETHLATAAAKRVERWRRIAREAAQQSRRVAVPEIAAPVKLKDGLARIGGACQKIVLAEVEREHALKDVLSGSPTVLAIGPEGGWTEYELRLFAETGWTTASLGPTILRAETAAIAALAITEAYRAGVASLRDSET
jgi:16S rRNA (uracil1498-N3)-methyltransferase